MSSAFLTMEWRSAKGVLLQVLKAVAEVDARAEREAGVAPGRVRMGLLVVGEMVVRTSADILGGWRCVGCVYIV